MLAHVSGIRMHIAARLSLATLLSVACGDGARSSAPSAEDDAIRYVANADALVDLSATLGDTLEAESVSGVLRLLHEPAFAGATLPAGSVALRVLYQSPFDGAAAVRIEHTPERCTVITVQSGNPTYHFGPVDSSGIQFVIGVDPPVVIRRDSVNVDVAQCEEMERLVAAVPLDRDGSHDSPLCDCAGVSIELTTHTRHDATFLWTSGDAPIPMMRAARHALTLGRVHLQ